MHCTCVRTAIDSSKFDFSSAAVGDGLVKPIDEEPQVAAVSVSKYSTKTWHWIPHCYGVDKQRNTGNLMCDKESLVACALKAREYEVKNGV